MNSRGSVQRCLFSRGFDDFELKLQFLAAEDRRKVKLPKLTGEAKSRLLLVQIRDEFQSQCPPEVRQRHVRSYRAQFERCVEGKRRAVRHKAREGVAIKLVAMCGVGRPIRIGIMWRENFYPASRPGYSMQLTDKRHDVGHMFDDVIADYFVELII